jgi:hypothetical protein
MRRPLIAIAAAAATAAVASITWLVLSTDEDAAAAAVHTTQSGGVEITATLVRLDSEGALVQVVLDTHVVELDLDIADNATLTVGRAEWGPPSWDGDGAGGHHRQGQLIFPARGSAEGTARLSIGGLSPPAVFEWDR